MKITILLLFILNIDFVVNSQFYEKKSVVSLLESFDHCKCNKNIEDQFSGEINLDYFINLIAPYDTAKLKLFALCAKEYSFGAVFFLTELYEEDGIESSKNLMAILFEKNSENYYVEYLGNDSYSFDETVNASYTKVINDRIIEVLMVKYNFDGSIELDRNYQYYKVNKDGFRKLEMVTTSQGRLFSDASLMLFKESDLVKLSKEDLDIMRNEIICRSWIYF